MNFYLNGNDTNVCLRLKKWRSSSYERDKFTKRLEGSYESLLACLQATVVGWLVGWLVTLVSNQKKTVPVHDVIFITP
jgi:hypothetical protein